MRLLALGTELELTWADVLGLASLILTLAAALLVVSRR